MTQTYKNMLNCTHKRNLDDTGMQSTTSEQCSVPHYCACYFLTHAILASIYHITIMFTHVLTVESAILRILVLFAQHVSLISTQLVFTQRTGDFEKCKYKTLQNLTVQTRIDTILITMRYFYQISTNQKNDNSMLARAQNRSISHTSQ